MTRFLLALFLVLLSLRPVDAEQLKSKLGFFIDMPSGFGLKNGDGRTRYAFTDPEGGMEYDILAYEPGRFADAPELASQTLGKLGSSGALTPYSYEGRKAILAELGFALNGASQKGYGLFIEGRKSAGGRGAIDEYSYALLAYAPEADFAVYSDFILSCIDSFSVDAAARRSPGPVSQFTLDWPPLRDGEKSVALAGGGRASLPWAEAEAEQEAQTDMREYKVLTAYADEPTLSPDAWARFYRMVYRESAARLDRLAMETTKTVPPEDPTEAARKILAWVQGFVYERDEKGSDFTPPLGRLRRDGRLRLPSRRRRDNSPASRDRRYPHGVARVFARHARSRRPRRRPALRLQGEEIPGRRDDGQNRLGHDSRRHGRLDKMDGNRTGQLTYVDPSPPLSLEWHILCTEQKQPLLPWHLYYLSFHPSWPTAR
jgi:hypothetical protein